MSKAELPLPPPEAVTKYNDLLRRHAETKKAVLKAMKAHTRDRDAEALLARWALEFNELERQYNFAPRQGPLQPVVDALVGEN